MPTLDTSSEPYQTTIPRQPEMHKIDQETGERRPGLNSKPAHVKVVVEGIAACRGATIGKALAIQGRRQRRVDPRSRRGYAASSFLRHDARCDGHTCVKEAGEKGPRFYE